MKTPCSLCGGSTEVTACGDGHLCQPCAEKNRVGRDSTTRKVKLMQTALRGKASIARIVNNGGTISDMDAYAVESAALLAMDDRQESHLPGAGGEALPQGNPELRDTMKTPGVVAMDASADRLRLVSQVGLDCAAAALDASDSIMASNSLERMAAHQLAVLHTTAMDYIAKANLQPSPELSMRMMNTGIRAMDTYQRGMLTIKRLRASGSQRITIEHVNVTSGGQAVIGQVQAGGRGQKG